MEHAGPFHRMFKIRVGKTEADDRDRGYGKKKRVRRGRGRRRALMADYVEEEGQEGEKVMKIIDRKATEETYQ